MQQYEKPIIIDDVIEIEDIIAISNGENIDAGDGPKVPATDLW